MFLRNGAARSIGHLLCYSAPECEDRKVPQCFTQQISRAPCAQASAVLLHHCVMVQTALKVMIHSRQYSTTYQRYVGRVCSLTFAALLCSLYAYSRSLAHIRTHVCFYPRKITPRRSTARVLPLSQTRLKRWCLISRSCKTSKAGLGGGPLAILFGGLGPAKQTRPC